MVENLFREVTEAAKNSGVHRPARTKRWYNAVTAGAFARYGREEVQVPPDAAGMGCSARVPNTVFEPLGVPPSVPDAQLQAIMGKADWRCFSPQSMVAGVGAWKALCWAFEENGWAKLASHWQCKLFFEGMVAVQKSSGQAFLVVKVFSAALVLWPMANHVHRGYDLYWPEKDGSPRWVVVTDHRLWSCVPCRPVPPAVFSADTGGNVPAGVVLLREHPQRSVLEAVAWQGFAGVPGLVVKKVMKLVGMSALDAPKRLLDQILLLVQKILPGLPKEAVASIMKARAGIGAQAPHSSWLSRGENAEHTEGVMDDGDRSLVKEESAAVGAKRMERVDMLEFLKSHKLLGARDLSFLADLVADPAVQAAKAKKAAAEPRAAKKPVVSWTPQALKKLKPQIKGCVVQNYPTLRKCIIYYPGVVPASRSRSWGTAFTQRQVWRHCLKWAWLHHTAKTGQACPWDLDAEV